MKTENIKNKIGRTFHRAGLKLKKHSPEILVTVGTVGVVASTVMACKATLQLNDILEEAKEDLQTVKDYMETEKFAENHTEEEGKRAVAQVYAQTGVKVVRLYAPAAIVGTAALAAIIGSHRIMRKRNVALAAAYKVVDAGFKEYRGRVVERFGEELDYELRHNIKAKEVTETIVDENGEEKTVTKIENVIDGEPSPYARFFDAGCVGWNDDAEDNLFIALSYQDYANKLLKSRGHVFLNEVYDMFGLPRTKAGQIVGWVYGNGDNHIDFGIHDLKKEKNRDFVNGYENVILLDFNVDGPIYDMIDEKQWGYLQG